MAQHVVAYGANIFRRHIASPMNERVRASGLGEVDTCTGATAESYHLLEVFQTVLFRLTCSEHDINDVLLDFLVQVHLFHNLTRLDDIRRAQDWQHLLLLRCDVLTDDSLLFFFLRIADYDLEHETVGLRFGQRIRSFLLYRVLGSQHQEWVVQLEGLLADGHLTLLHRLEQGTLHFRRSTVNLICQHKISEDRSAFDFELLALLAVNLRTEHIGRQQVRSKLNSAEIRLDEVA